MHLLLYFMNIQTIIYISKEFFKFIFVLCLDCIFIFCACKVIVLNVGYEHKTSMLCTLTGEKLLCQNNGKSLAETFIILARVWGPFITSNNFKC